MRYLFFIIFLLSTYLVRGQQTWKVWKDVQVIEGTNTLDNPWAGGNNSPNFSEIDLNGDSIMDLFVFDKLTNYSTTYINNGLSGIVSYSEESSYTRLFPNLINFALLRDYNCDGYLDIFEGDGSKVAIYKNTFNSSTGLGFTKVNAGLDFIYPDTNQIWIKSVDIPAIDDLDNDGDLDIVTTNNWTDSILFSYYQNLSMDSFGTCDSLWFKYADACWGGVKENSSANYLNAQWGVTCKGINTAAVPTPEAKSGQHSGSATLTLDFDADGVKDVVYSENGFSNSIGLFNAGDTFTASINQVDTFFPSYTTPVNFLEYPASYYLDIDNDNKKDLIVSSNSWSGADVDNIWSYKNLGQTNNPNFSFSQQDFLQDEMVDLGSFTHPIFFDYNQDSLLDILVGNKGVAIDSFCGLNLCRYPSLALFENTGTAANPEFTFVTDNYMNTKDLLQGEQDIHPTLWDYQNDGDLDIIVGTSTKYAHLLVDTSSVGQNPSFQLQAANYIQVFSGSNSAPTTYDVNDDGLDDIIMGENSGELSYFQDQGGALTTLPNVANAFGNLPTIFSVKPFLFDVDSNTTGVYLSGQGPYLYYFEGPKGSPTVTYSPVDTFYVGQSYLSVTGADIDNDGSIELLCGTSGGGLVLLKFMDELQLVSPVNNNTDLTNPVKLDWSSVNQTGLYEYQIDTNPSFNSSALQSGQKNFINLASLNSDTEQELNLAGGTTYHWRVRTIDGTDTSSWTNSWQFTTINFLAGDTNNNGQIDTNEVAGDVNMDGKIDSTEIAGDLNGDGVIACGSEIAGDINGDGIIVDPELAGDGNGNGVIDGSEIAGDCNGDGVITGSEIAGDVNGDGNILGSEIAGDINGDGIIDCPNEIAGDVNGNRVIDGSEIEGDINGDYIIGLGEIEGDCNGNGILDGGEADSIEELTALFSQIKIYPNPADEKLIIELPTGLKELQFKMINLVGQHMSSGTIDKPKQEMNVLHYKPGIYFISLSSENYHIIDKWVKN